MKILLTGSSGWLGIHLHPLLKEAGHELVGLDPVPGPCTGEVGSIADAELVEALFQRYRFEAVIHAGVLHKPDIVRYLRQAFIDVNVTGTLNLLEAAVRHRTSRFVFTSTTSLMISQRIRDEQFSEAVWLDENTGPLEPRNIYGVTKLAAEGLSRQMHLETGLPVVILRTSRFFPEEDDTHRELSGPNLKANELLHRRASVQDMARAHLAAVEGAVDLGFGLFIVSAPTPFQRTDISRLKADARAVIQEKFPEAEALYGKNSWQLPSSIGRIYDGSLITRKLGFCYKTTFADVLKALREDRELPLAHDPAYTSPLARAG
jgi:nucleoside-diphosphate-sugar epimerase